MRKGTIAAVGILVTALTGYIGFNAWVAFVPPKRPVSTYSYAPECEKIEARGNAHAGSPLECQARIFEADRLKAHPGVAVRERDDLTVYYRGAPSARLVAARGDRSDCNSFTVHKVLPVQSQASGGLEPLAQISCHYGEFESRFVVLPDGRRWMVGDATASPDGRLIATGQNRADVGDLSSRLTLVSWPDGKVVARFRQMCRVLTWHDETRFSVTCLDNLLPGKGVDAEGEPAGLAWEVAFDAKVWRDDKGVWRMQATRWLSPGWQYNDAGDIEYPPTFSLLPLPRFTAEASSQMAF